MTDIVERLAGIRRQLDGSKNPYAAGTVQAGISEIERLRRIINEVHPQMQTRIDALIAERDEAIQRGNDWCDQAQRARAEMRNVMEWVGMLEDSGRALTDEVERLRGELRKIARGAFTALGDGDE